MAHSRYRILWVFVCLLVTKALPAKDPCDLFRSALFKLQARERLLSQGDLRFVQAGLEIPGGGICGPICVLNKLELWGKVMDVEVKLQPVDEVRNMVKEHGRDNRNGMDPAELAQSLLWRSHVLPGNYQVELVGNKLEDVPANPDVLYSNRFPKSSDLGGSYPSIVLLQVRMGDEIIGYHYILVQPTERGDISRISDPHYANTLNTVDFESKEVDGRPILYAPGAAEYHGELVTYVVESVVRLVPKN